MATIIKGLLAHNLDWQFVAVGAALAVTVELCGVGALSFAVGAYLPLATTAPIFVGGLVRAFADWSARRQGAPATPEEAELGAGNLFATGLVAGGAIAGVTVAFLTLKESWARIIAGLSVEHGLTGQLGPGGYQMLGLSPSPRWARPCTKSRVGAARKTRTCYPRLRRPVLYPDELQPRMEANVCRGRARPSRAKRCLARRPACLAIVRRLPYGSARAVDKAACGEVAERPKAAVC